MATKTSILELKNFIGGEFVSPLQGKYIDSVNPSTGEPFARVPDSDEQDIEKAVSAAKAAFPKWASKTAEERSKILLKVADILESRLEEFAQLESQDQGKPITTARTVDIPRAVSNFRFFATSVLHHQDTSCVTNNNEAVNYTVRTPVGVAGLISPWNLPLYLLTWKIAPALASGNTCVAKPSELTSVTAHRLGEVLNAAGVPPGVCNLVFGRGAQAGNALVAHPDVPLISFTGGTATALHIQKTAAPYYKKLSLELGGKNPNIIFADADLKECIPTSVRSSFANQGEICLCGSRIFVQEGIYDKFIAYFVAAVSEWKVGAPSDPAVNMGALVSKEHMDKVRSYIELAKTEGCQILLGGDSPVLSAPYTNGFYVNPTIIANVALNSRLQTEEIFGPVVTVTRFKTEEEVVEWANSVKYGLAASVWTRDVKTAHRVAHQLQSGIVWVNCWMLRDLRTPFGGVKQSGIGREGGDYSLDFFTEIKNVVIKL